MKKTILIPIILLGFGLANAQVIHQWNFNDTATTTLPNAADSVGSVQFNSNTTNPGNWTTNGSGQLTGGDGTIGNADIANVSTGIYRMELTGITFTALSGGTDDFGVFGLRSFTSPNITGFGTQGDSSSNEAVIVFGNENGTSGLDFEIIDNNSDILVTDVTTDFTGTFDFRIDIDLDNDTADYFWQRNGGGFNNIVTQQFNGVATIDALALGGGTFSDTISIDQASWAAIPEPSTLLLVGVALGSLAIFRRRK